MTDKKMPKNAEIFECKLCNFKCSKQSNLNSHLLTRKHKNTYKYLQNTDILELNNANIIFVCLCGKKYKHRQSLFNHKKKCIKEKEEKEKEEKEKEENKENKEKEENKENKEKEEKEEKKLNNLIEIQKQNQDIINELLKQNLEFKDLIIEVCKKDQISNINNTLINSNNKTFNLNVFLNEDCKDAMNISEFANSIVINLEELESIGKLGYVNSITNIIKNKLNLLDIHKRPVHCTDLKRETIYIKDNNVWEKDTTNKFLKNVAVISKKNCSMIYIFKDTYPDYKNPKSKQSDVYDVLCSKIYHASDENINKVIKKLLKEITINK